jgi:hypothetical protein
MPATTQTLMLKWGDWFGPTAFAAATLMLATVLVLRPRRTLS